MRTTLKLFAIIDEGQIGIFRYTWNQGPSGSSGSDIEFEAMAVSDEGELVWTPLEEFTLLAPHVFPPVDRTGRVELFRRG